MRAIVVTDQAAGMAGMTLAERPEPKPALNDVIVQVHASGFTPGELTWPSTWTDRLGRDRTPSIPGHELAGVVSALGYGTTGLSVGQRVFGLTDWNRDGTLAEYAAVEARNLAPLPGDVDFTVGASLPISGLTAWQGLFVHGRFQAGQSVLVHGAAGGVGSMVTQLATEAGAYVIGTGRAADRQTALDFGAQEFVDLDNDTLEDVAGVDLVFDVIGGEIQKRSAGLVRAGGTLVTIAGPPEARPADGLTVDFVVEADRAQLGEVVRRIRDGRLRTNIGTVAALDDAVAAFNRTERTKGKTIIRVRSYPGEAGQPREEGTFGQDQSVLVDEAIGEPHALALDLHLVNDEKLGIYGAIVGDREVAGLTYNVAGDDRLVLLATSVIPEFRRQGVATELIRQVLDDVRVQGKTVTVMCPIVRGVIDHNPEYADLVDPEHPGAALGHPRRH
ncbi:GNAT family N-acetyltransferase [Micromonospora chersina]|uniref:NADPH:quinone reductase n=1 Tax=Micromonospora chersina TaxID=47854 RepID=A0A1C6U7Q9_9ACTN|nr:GNAT family N-acetyltransferase [Micromonospora chersina]SCL50096.1 NADPH:quinone reductase [Micromonospora chersina]